MQMELQHNVLMASKGLHWDISEESTKTEYQFFLKPVRQTINDVKFGNMGDLVECFPNLGCSHHADSLYFLQITLISPRIFTFRRKSSCHLMPMLNW